MFPNTGSLDGYEFNNNIAYGKPLGLPKDIKGITVKKPDLKKKTESLSFPFLFY